MKTLRLKYQNLTLYLRLKIINLQSFIETFEKTWKMKIKEIIEKKWDKKISYFDIFAIEVKVFNVSNKARIKAKIRAKKISFALFIITIIKKIIFYKIT